MRQKARAAPAAFDIQLVLSVAWPVILFGVHRLFYGFVVIAALRVTIASALKCHVWVLNV